MKHIWLLLIVALPCKADVTVTRELLAPEHLSPGQPVQVAVTFWTDRWFNPPPEWPQFPLENGMLLTTRLPSQLLTRQKGSTRLSGVRMTRQISAWEQGVLRLPSCEMTISDAGGAAVKIFLPELKKNVSWPKDVQQQDRFLPASQLTLTQKIIFYRAAKDNVLRAGDVIERVVSLQAKGILPVQIPQLLYAIPGTHTQRMEPVNEVLTSGRGEFEGGRRTETLRYLPVDSGTITLPPIRLRWWDTTHQKWQNAELPASQYQIAAMGNAGTESLLEGEAASSPWLIPWIIAIAILLACLLFIFRHSLKHGAHYARQRLYRFWHPIFLPGQIPQNRSHQ